MGGEEGVSMCVGGGGRVGGGRAAYTSIHLLPQLCLLVGWIYCRVPFLTLQTRLVLIHSDLHLFFPEYSCKEEVKDNLGYMIIARRFCRFCAEQLLLTKCWPLGPKKIF